MRRMLRASGMIVVLASAVSFGTLALGSSAAMAAPCGVPVAAGTSCTMTGTVTLTGGTLALTSPAALTWIGTLTGSAQSIVDVLPTDQQMTVTDATGSGSGWHITTSATTFTSGANTFPNLGTFVFNGSLSSVTSTSGPSATCVGLCTVPTNTTTYPVAITTAAVTPTPVTTFDTSTSTGIGVILIGGAVQPNPIGWWVNVPATAIAGTYTSTITQQIISGPKLTAPAACPAAGNGAGQAASIGTAGSWGTPVMRRTNLTRFRSATAHPAPWLAAISALACFTGMLILAPPAAAASLTSVSWFTSKSTTGATATSYTYRFTTASASSLSSVTMTVPTGTGGTPTVGTVTPAAIAGGTVALAGTTLTYSFTAAAVATGQAVSIQVNGITNTGTVGSSTSTVTTKSGGTSVDTGTSGTVTFTSAALTSPTWTVSSTTTGATGVTYTYGFSNLLAAFTTITATVPPGTSGTPAIGATSGISLGSVSLSGTTLTLSVVSVNIGAVSFAITGLTNTSVAGSYPSEIVAIPLIGGASSGITPAVTFTGGLTLTSPTALGWTGSTGVAQSLVDPTAAHKQFSLDDERGSGAGWHITVSATTFTAGLNTLPNSGTFVFTGSVTSVTATTAPSTSCNPSCTLPVPTTTYPVAITTAATSPTPVTVFNAGVGSGTGPLIIGGSGAANPVGWWINVLAVARAGSYASTITVNVISGP